MGARLDLESCFSQDRASLRMGNREDRLFEGFLALL
jgi:hypothetical protein